MDLSPAAFRPRRRGVTLVELLVIISIMVVLTAVAVPAMRPALEGRRIREAARAINMYLDSARNRAIETGRPCGVSIQRFGALPQCAMELDQVEVPPPYAGDTDNARIVLVAGQPIQFTPAGAGDSWSTLVNDGDLIQLNYQGYLYRIGNADPKLAITLTNTTDASIGVALPTVILANGVPFKVFRQPQKSHATPLQLPAGAVADLESSGSDDFNFAPIDLDSNTPGIQDEAVTILFSPNGAAYQLYHSYNVTNPLTGAKSAVYGPTDLTGPIYLLIGKRERVPAGLAQDGKSNWQDLTNLWVTLNPQTGLISTTEVAVGNDVFTARAFARQGQSMGGR